MKPAGIQTGESLSLIESGSQRDGNGLVSYSRNLPERGTPMVEVTFQKLT